MTDGFTTPIPNLAGIDNWAYVLTDAWISEHGGTELTDSDGTEDESTFVGTVLRQGTVYILTADMQQQLVVGIPTTRQGRNTQ